MQSFLQPFDEKLSLTALPRLQTVHVVRRARLAVRSRCPDRNHRADFRRRPDPREPHRIVPRVFVRARRAVRPGRKDEFGADVAHAQPARRRRRILGEYLDAEKLVQIPDAARNHHQRRNRRHTQRQVLFEPARDLDVDPADLHVRPRHLQLRRQPDGLRQRIVDPLDLRQPLLQLRRRYDLGRRAKLRRHHRKPHRKHLAIEHEPDLEFDRAEIRLVDHDAALLDLVQRERPRRDPRDENLLEYVHRHRRRAALQQRLVRRPVGQPDSVERIIAGQIQRRQQERRARRRDQPPRRKRWPPQIRLHVTPRGRRPGQVRRHRTRDIFRDGQGGRGNRQPRSAHAVVERGQRLRLRRGGSDRHDSMDHEHGENRHDAAPAAPAAPGLDAQRKVHGGARVREWGENSSGGSARSTPATAAEPSKRPEESRTGAPGETG